MVKHQMVMPKDPKAVPTQESRNTPSRAGTETPVCKTDILKNFSITTTLLQY